MAAITPVILAGGSGTRLWPLSRTSYPKQYLALLNEQTLFQNTVQRVQGGDFAPPLILCNEEHRFVVMEQLRQIESQAAGILLEPVGRNTAPAICLAALHLLQTQPDAVMLVMPSDHVITDPAAFLRAVESGRQAVSHGGLVTFGISPSHPETGYGYIRAGQPFHGLADVCSIERFVEKPDLDTARHYLAEGCYLWNSGLFLLSAAGYVQELQRTSPAMVTACRTALEQGQSDHYFWRPDAAAFAASPSDSIDYAVMEKTTRAAVVPVDMGWNDIGAWSALWDLGPRDEQDNVGIGKTLLHQTSGCYIRSEGPLVATLGVQDLLVVATEDAVLVADRTRAQDVKVLVERLKDLPEGQTLHQTSTVHRPWGSYRGIDHGERFQVKRITVMPGERLSLQMHHHRAEHWIVVEGTALVTRGEETFLLHENQSTFISAGQIHRLENPGKVPLHLIEVQSGGYLGEDDIVRLEDGYGRIR